MSPFGIRVEVLYFNINANGVPVLPEFPVKQAYGSNLLGSVAIPALILPDSDNPHPCLTALGKNFASLPESLNHSTGYSYHNRVVSFALKSPV